MKLRAAAFALAAPALLGAAPLAMAQVAQGPVSCDPAFDGPGIFNTPGLACARATISRLLLLNNIDVIRRVTAVSFGMGPETIEAAGLTDLTLQEAAERLGDDAAATIAPAADVVTTAPASRFNVWADGKYTWNDSSRAAFDLDGPLHNAQFGMDYKLTSRVTLGVMGTYEDSHLTGIGLPAPDLSSSGWGIGPYFGVTLTPNIIWSGNFLYSNVDSSQNDFYHYDSDRYQAATAVTGYFYRGTWRLSPSLALSWSKENQVENAGLVPRQEIETAVLSPSVQFGDTLKLGDTATAEPWVGAAIDYTFVNRIEDAVAGVIVDHPNTDLRVQAGLNLGLGSSAQLAITGEVGGLLLDNSNTYAAEANLAIQF